MSSVNGNTISYDNNGCVISYGGKTFTWNRGKLASVTDGTTVHNYSYNSLGQRTKKRSTYSAFMSAVTDYTYDNSGRLISETYETLDKLALTRKIVYLYDDSGVIGMVYDSVTYYFGKNLQGDITEIYDTSGNLVVKYGYDAFGNCTVLDGTTNTSLASANHIRYRGYYCDEETGLYYLGARYYNPEWRRFISPDDTSYIAPETPNGLNLYCYCNNDPVNFVDPSGHSWESFWNSVSGKIIGTVLIAGAMIALSIATAGIGTAVVGALGGGFLAAVAGGAVGGAISGAIFGTGMSMISQGITNGYSNIDYGKVAIDGLVGMASGAATGALFAAAGRGLGLLGKTKWAQRELANYTQTSNNFLFGSDKSFTFMRFGHNFRLDASMKVGLHFHGIVSSAEHWKLIFQIGNIVSGFIPSFINQIVF